MDFVIFGRKVPVIKEVYDPLTVCVMARLLRMLRSLLQVKTCVYLHLELFTWVFLPVSDKGTLIHVKRVFKYTDTEVLVILPNLEPGRILPGNDDSYW